MLLVAPIFSRSELLSTAFSFTLDSAPLALVFPLSRRTKEVAPSHGNPPSSPPKCFSPLLSPRHHLAQAASALQRPQTEGPWQFFPLLQDVSTSSSSLQQLFPSTSPPRHLEPRTSTSCSSLSSRLPHNNSNFYYRNHIAAPSPVSKPKPEDPTCFGSSKPITCFFLLQPSSTYSLHASNGATNHLQLHVRSSNRDHLYCLLQTESLLSFPSSSNEIILLFSSAPPRKLLLQPFLSLSKPKPKITFPPPPKASKPKPLQQLHAKPLRSFLPWQISAVHLLFSTQTPANALLPQTVQATK